MEVTSLHGVLTCCIENKVDKPGYLEVLRDVMEPGGHQGAGSSTYFLKQQ